ncbi:MAG: ATP-binding protein [Clostridiales bacterium]|nr:ATP-binding protein [Clostridiales bacterium]
MEARPLDTVQQDLYGNEHESMENRMAGLRAALLRLKNSGVTFAQVERDTGVSRPTISRFASGDILIGESILTTLEGYVKEIMEVERLYAPEPQAPQYKRELELWEHEEYLTAIGWCTYVVEHRKMGVMIGAPGTGKTTILKQIMRKYPNSLYIEAMPSMRVGDLIDSIARGAGVSVRGNAYTRFKMLLAGLRNHSDFAILVDEAEYLKKWDVDKFEYLRKIWDNTGIPIILAGTAELATILTRGAGKDNLAQLYRRKYELPLKGLSMGAAIQILRQYDCTTDARQMLSKIGADTAHGGLGTMCEILDMCLSTANGGTITGDTVRAAQKYKLMF